MRTTNYWAGDFTPPVKTNPRWCRKRGNRPHKYKPKPPPPAPAIDLQKVRSAVARLARP